MDNFQQNFDQNLSSGNGGGLSGGSSGYQYGAPRSRVTTIIAIFALILSLGATGGMWLWRSKMSQGLQDAQTQLAAAGSKYKKTDIDELIRQRDDLIRARELVARHPIPSTLIDWLADNTEATVFWSGFSYHKGAPGDKNPMDSLDINGSAQGYTGLIVQMRHFRGQDADIVKLGGATRIVELGSYSLDDKSGRVNFSVKLSLDPDYVSLPRVVARGASGVTPDAAAAQAVVPASVPTPSASTSIPVKATSTPASVPSGSSTPQTGSSATSTKGAKQ